ncbi:MAG TPA: hypothetical protein VJ044_13575 [Candidatus Hodarchaeales archaeon]|nr:hypothetical protein [Candidatus Hodarchaeales archaeon]
MSEPNPTYDKSSEQACEHQDRAEEIFHERMSSLDPATLEEAFKHARINDSGAAWELCDNLKHDDAYSGALMYGIVKDFIWHESDKQAEREKLDREEARLMR